MSMKLFKTSDTAFDEVQRLYLRSIEHLKNNFEEFSKGNIPDKPVRAHYPLIRFVPQNMGRNDNRLSYGFVPKMGEYSATLTRPDIFDFYYKEQFRLLLENHDGDLEVGYSETPIPIHFALGEYYHLEDELSAEAMASFSSIFDQPDLADMDDEISNSRFEPNLGEALPLSLFTAPRVDLSLSRLKHYTGTGAKHFQNYVIFTNYQFYIDEFIRIGQDSVADTDNGYSEFVEPGEGETLSRMPQMPAYHIKRPDGSGITMVNIGVGPSNAKTITDHIAVLRPHSWLMLGHCAGLRNSQKLGDYVLAHAYLRLDNIWIGICIHLSQFQH